MIRFAALCLCLLAQGALAQGLPALYAVTGVASDDVLNIRSQPKADAAIIGTLPPDSTGIEVISVEDGWAVVNTAEASGYAALRFLRRQDAPTWSALQTPLTCLGTEPFWSLTLDPATDTAKLVASDDLNGYTLQIEQSWPGTLWAPAAALSLPQGTVVLYPAECSDGMSERSYGIAVDLFLTQPEKLRLSGCCRLTQP